MTTKQFIISILALTSLGCNVWADTDKLPASDGWTKITTAPTASEIASNYYVFVDATRDLMLGIGKGANQNTKWYSLGVYYREAVEPTAKDFIPLTWTLESYGSGYAMRNLDQPASPFQTEWNAAWKFDTNDVYATANEWTEVRFALADGVWTLQNGKYPSSGYIGPWNDGNFTNGAECAANKSGNNVGKFHIYAISRAQFMQNLLDNASESNPVDLTPWYVSNATFDANNRTGWTEEGSGGNNNTTIGCEIWHRSNFRIYQDLTVPNGKYQVSLQIAGTTGAGQVYATSGSTTQTASSSAAAGSDFQNTVLSMIQDRTFGQTMPPEITVANGSLRIGMKCETTDQWLVFDNFKLYCTGIDLSAYESQLASAVSECNSFIESDVVPASCNTVISSAITTYNKSYDTATEYSSAIIALTAVLNTYRNDTEIQLAYAAYKDMRAKVQELADKNKYKYTDYSSAKNTFDAAISAANSAVGAATTVEDINTQTANIRSAAMTFISSVTAEDGNPFNITFLASQNYRDWKKIDGSAAGEVTWAVSNRGDLTFAESYESNCATTGTVLYQTVSGLPAGYYQVGMYAMAAYTPGRGFTSEATEGDANRSFAFAGDQRKGIAIPFKSEFDLSELTTLDVNVHLSSSGDLTFGVHKNANGSNWHFAQIMSICYSNTPDLTLLKATRDALVSEANGLLASDDANLLTATQRSVLASAISEGESANTFEELNTATLTTIPNAIYTARQQIQIVKDNRQLMIAALERFENDYNLADGTDYRRLTMSADAWTTLLSKVDALTNALDDVSQAANYGTIKDELIAQMDATDASLRLFRGYKAMVEGTQALSLAAATTYATDDNMDSDATEDAAITALNSAFVTYAATQDDDIVISAFLGNNLDFSAEQGSVLNNQNSNSIYNISNWDVQYSDADTWAVIQNQHIDYANQLYIRKNWGSAATKLTVAKHRMLPVGSYKLTFSWNSNMNNMSNLSYYKIGNSENVTIGKATNGAETLEYEFEVSGEPQLIDLCFGFQKTGEGNSPAQLIADNITLTYLQTTLTLANNADNNDRIDSRAGRTCNVTLDGRTLYKDGDWNTLCLPFNTTATGPLADATILELDVDGYYEGNVRYDANDAGETRRQTGFDASDGTLYLFFKPASCIEANKPYLVKWESGQNIVNPVFNKVEVVSSGAVSVGTNHASGLENVQFIGTLNPVNIDKDDKSRLFMGEKNTLYYPNTDNYSVKTCRAYFHVDLPEGSAGVHAFYFNFGDEIATGIASSATANTSDTWYDLNGRRLSGRPSKKGVYVSEGRKVVLK
ncbi:MAG: hypothetical protein J5486_02150 [Bacteroidaceae bacterium]|nr:hypothetical protein [Bacteroidaceae bacterium]